MRPTDACPCGSGDPYGGCCGPLHHGQRHAETAERLMRSRFSAYAIGDLGYVWRTWHPRTRPEALTPDASLEWTALEVLDVAAGAAGDDNGEVEFRAHYLQDRRSGTLHERSRFVVRARRWFYVDGMLFE